MATVKYSGPVASFHCPTEATIRSLKVHFSPKRLGEGTPSPENIRKIVEWNGVEVYNCSKLYASAATIPNEYKKVEYLESTGTQYIYSNVPGRSGVECKAKVSWIEGGAGDACIFGARKYASDRIMLIHQYPLQRWTIGNGDSYTGLSWIDYNIPYFVEAKTAIGEQYLKINGNTIYTGTDTTEYINNFNLSIFACTRASEDNITLFAKARVYYLIASINDNVVLNAVPCIRKSDNKPGLYDTVSSTFLTNAGTGEFLYGPEIIGYTTNYEFGVLGKNKLPITTNMEIKSVDTGYNNSLQRDMTPGILYPNVSANNYWLGTSAKTFVQEVQNGSITFQANDGSYGIGTFVSVQPQATYTISYTTSDNQARMRIGYYDADGYFTGTHQVINNGASFTIPDGAYHMIVVATPSINYYNQLITVSNLQLELGSTATAYEPYDPNKTVYGGWADLINGEVCEEWYNVDPSEWIKYKESNGYYAYRLDGAPSSEAYSPTAGIQKLSNIISQYGSFNSSNMNKNIIQYPNYLALQQDISVETVEYIYKLATPIHYHIAPIALQTFLFTNNIWSNADYVEVEYDLHETQDILARKQFIIANQPHIKKLVAVPVQNFVTDMVAPLKECKVYFNPIQEGDGNPSPDNVRAISGWTKINIIHCGKNLLNHNDPNYGNYTINSDGTYNEASGRISSDYIPCIGGNKYTASGSGAVQTISKAFGFAGIAFFDENKTYISREYRNQVNSFTATAPSNARYMRFFSSATKTSYIPYTPSIFETVERQLELGPAPTSYELYNGTVIPIDWADEVGTIYGGYIDLIYGVLVETQRIFASTWGELILRGSYADETMIVKKLVLDTSVYPTGDSHDKSFSNIVPRIWKWTECVDPHYYIGDSETIWIFLPSDTNNDTLIQIVCNLTEPVTYQLDPITLKTLRGTNNIWSNANGNIELSYWKH